MNEQVEVWVWNKGERRRSESVKSEMSVEGWKGWVTELILMATHGPPICIIILDAQPSCSSKKKKKKQISYCIFQLPLLWNGFATSHLVYYMAFQVVRACVLSCIQLLVTPWSLPDSSVHGIFQARILGWVAISFSSFRWNSRLKWFYLWFIPWSTARLVSLKYHF